MQSPPHIQIESHIVWRAQWRRERGSRSRIAECKYLARRRSLREALREKQKGATVANSGAIKRQQSLSVCM
jgi:hypothetical protein